MSRALLSLLVALLVALASPLAVRAGEGPYLFVGNERLRPLIYSQDGEPAGLVVQITRAMAEAAGLDIEIRVLDWARAQEMVQRGEADALLQINWTEERDGLYDFSVPLLDSNFTIFRRVECIDIHGRHSLQGKTVGVEAMGLPCTVLREDPDILLRPIASWREGFEEVRSGVIDAVVVDRWIGEYELYLAGFNDIVPVSSPVAVSCSSIAVRKGNRELLDRINEGLTTIQINGTRERILSEWSGKRIVYLPEEKMKAYYVIGGLALVNVILLVVAVVYARLLMKTKKEAEKLASTDGLTGLFNYRSFYAAAERELAIAGRHGRPLSVVQIDIDSFKEINDAWGHLFGDTVLVAVADAIRQSVRSTDICARMGGDEFTLLLPETAADEARIVAERVRCAVAALTMRASTDVVSLSVSIGVTTETGGGSDLEGLIREADDALYEAKRGGRNQVDVYGACPNAKDPS